MYVESVSLTLIFGHPITTSSSGPLNCFHSSEVTFIYDCPLKWTGNLVHWLFLCVGKAKQTFQIMGFTLSLDINESKEMLPAKTKQEPRNEKRMNLASINKSINQSFKYISGITYIHTAYHMGINARQKLFNFCILGVFRVLSWKLCNLAPINYM